VHDCILDSVLPADLPEVVGPRQGRAGGTGGARLRDSSVADEPAGLTKMSGSIHLGLTSGFESPDLDRPGRQPHQQGPCAEELGYQDESLAPHLDLRP